MTDPDTPRRRTGLRIAAVATGAVLAAGAVAAATLVPLPAYTVGGSSVVVQPVATAQQRACAGPVLAVGGDGAVTSSGEPATYFAATSGEVTASSLVTTDNTTGTTPAVGGLVPVDAASQLSGSQSETVTGDDQAGFAVASCAEGAHDSWLVGGATTTGRSTVVTLGNPSSVAATVDLALYGEGGAISAPGTEGISVPAGAQRVLSLAGFAPDVVSPVVHVSSRGGAVVADLQQTTVRTLAPGGVDIVGPAAPPSTSAVIPGVLLAEVDAVGALQGQEGYDDLVPTLRVVAPGDAPASATVTVVPADPANTGTAFPLTLEPGVVQDIPVEGFAAGAYTVLVESDQPVVAGMRVATADDAGANDFAWSAASEPLSGTTLAALAPGDGASLHLTNPSETPAIVTLTAQAGGSSSLEVPAGSAVTAPVTTATSYELTGTEGLHAAVTYSVPGFAGWLALGQPAPASSPITVYPVPR
jgi:hypothetical protein